MLQTLILQSSISCESRSCLNRHQNSQLLADARAARTYRDELDALRERAIKADKLESEAGRYREQLHKMEFYKAKVEVGALETFLLIVFRSFVCQRASFSIMAEMRMCSQ